MAWIRDLDILSLGQFLWDKINALCKILFILTIKLKSISDHEWVNELGLMSHQYRKVKQRHGPRFKD